MPGPHCEGQVGIAVGTKTDIGLKRLQNEDSFCADARLGLFVVCDGMGGSNAGEVASRLATEAIHGHVCEVCANPQLPLIGEYDPQFSSETNRLASAVRFANATIYSTAKEQTEYAGMGTTVVAAYLNGPVTSIAHVGDSRLYLVRDEELKLLTCDHSLVAEQVRRGLLTEEEAEQSPQRHIITRALGVDKSVDVTLNETMAMRGDALLLCSDGLTKGVHGTDILRAIRRAGDPQAACEVLIGLANRAGGDDNTTVIVIMWENSGDQSLWSRMASWMTS
jgi:protein phosphatase